MIVDMGPALSALESIQRAFANSAHNTANALTDNYDPSRAVFRPLESSGVAVNMQRQNQPVRNDRSGRSETPAPDAEPRPSGTDLAEEAANAIAYGATYKANLNVIKVQDEMAGALIDIIG
jgi:flagellar hook-associated protein FlgK